MNSTASPWDNTTCRKKTKGICQLKSSRICHPKRICLYDYSSGHATPKYAALVLLIILNYRHLENSKCRQGFSQNSPYLPKHTDSKWNSVVINPLPRSFIDQERLTHLMGEVTGSPHHTQTHFVTIYHASHPFL